MTTYLRHFTRLVLLASLVTGSMLRELVAAGMTLVGPKPETAPGLKDYPRCDQQLQTIAAELWGNCDGNTVTERAYGKGRVVYGRTIRDVLQAGGVKPDFEYTAQPGAFLDWIHRNADGSDIYFIFNRKDRTEKAECRFRIAGRQPELWDPVTGEVRDAAAFSQADGRTMLPLEFAPYQSLLVVFRKPARCTAFTQPLSNNSGTNRNSPATAVRISRPDSRDSSRTSATAGTSEPSAASSPGRGCRGRGARRESPCSRKMVAK